MHIDGDVETGHSGDFEHGLSADYGNELRFLDMLTDEKPVSKKMELLMRLVNVPEHRSLPPRGKLMLTYTEKYSPNEDKWPEVKAKDTRNFILVVDCIANEINRRFQEIISDQPLSDDERIIALQGEKGVVPLGDQINALIRGGLEAVNKKLLSEVPKLKDILPGFVDGLSDEPGEEK